MSNYSNMSIQDLRVALVKATMNKDEKLFASIKEHVLQRAAAMGVKPKPLHEISEERKAFLRDQIKTIQKELDHDS